MKINLSNAKKKTNKIKTTFFRGFAKKKFKKSFVYTFLDLPLIWRKKIASIVLHAYLRRSFYTRKIH